MRFLSADRKAVPLPVRGKPEALRPGIPFVLNFRRIMRHGKEIHFQRKRTITFHPCGKRVFLSILQLELVGDHLHPLPTGIYTFQTLTAVNFRFLVKLRLLISQNSVFQRNEIADLPSANPQFKTGIVQQISSGKRNGPRNQQT